MPQRKQKSARIPVGKIKEYESMAALREMSWDAYINWLLEQDLQNKKRLLQEKLEEISKNDM